jgi:hypothetical protein
LSCQRSHSRQHVKSQIGSGIDQRLNGAGHGKHGRRFGLPPCGFSELHLKISQRLTRASYPILFSYWYWIGLDWRHCQLYANGIDLAYIFSLIPSGLSVIALSFSFFSLEVADLVQTLLCDPISIRFAELFYERTQLFADPLRRPFELSRKPFVIVWKSLARRYPYAKQDLQISAMLNI